MQWVRDYTPDLDRRRLFRQAMIITLIGNIALAIGKGVVAYLSGSVALYADAANSVSDVFYSLLMVLVLRLSQQPPDLGHPQGHSRFEPVAGLLVAAAMTYAGVEAGRTAIMRFIEGAIAVNPGLPTLVLLASAAIKAGMFVAIRRIARQVNSPTLETTASDNLSDVLTSIAAFIGVLGSNFLWPILDPLAGMAVSLWILRIAFGAWGENLKYLTGAGASPELRVVIAETAQSVSGVHDVHQVITEYVGPQLVADLHVDVNGSLTLYEAHHIADEVQARLEALPDVDRAYVHVEPEKPQRD